MADPLAVAGLAVGVLSLGLEVSGGIVTYIDALNCRSKDIASVEQQNDLLQKSLKVIATSLSRLRPDHAEAAAVVIGCLDSCKKELSALNTLVSDLSACDKSTTSWNERLMGKEKKLLYPFNRPKVQQLEARISNAIGAL